MKRAVWSVILFLSLVSLYARGTEEKDYQNVQGLENWNHEFDLSTLKPGQYNLLIRSKDVAGNVSYAGPFNIVYDPASALPIVSIANPVAWMKVSSDLNVVGTASATNRIGKVEVQVDSGEWKPAKGKEFWNYRLDLASLPDGQHQLTVRGFDTNGLMGAAATVSFYVDQYAPVTTITSHQIGDLVAGEFDLLGNVSSENGIASLEMSLDGAKTFQSLGLNGDQKDKKRLFQYHLKTKEFEDGPLVVWFKATDKLKVESRFAFLLFIDNTPPKIEVYYPGVDTPVAGKTRLVGKVTKFLGVESLSFKIGEGKPQTITTVPGNPYWVADVDLSEIKDKEAKLTLEAVDHSKNKSVLEYKVKIDQELILPQLMISPSLDKASVTAPVFLSGTIKDLQGPKSVAYTLNDAKEVVVDVGTSFRIPLENVISGVNKLTVTPINLAGLRGHPVVSTFTAAMGPPVISLDQLVVDQAAQDLSPGMTIYPDKKNVIKGKLLLGNDLKEFTWSIGDKPPVKLELPKQGKQLDFSLVLPENPPFGIVPLKVEATDIFGLKSNFNTFVRIANFSVAQGPSGLAFADTRLVEGQTLVLTPDTPLKGYFLGGDIQKIELSAAAKTAATASAGKPAPKPAASSTNILSATFDGSLVKIQSVSDGKLEGVKVKITTTKGRIYTASLGNIVSDTAGPEIKFSSPLPGTWSKESLKLVGVATDANGLKALDWSADNGKSWQSLPVPGDRGGPFQVDVNLPAPDGAYSILVRAIDAADRIGTVVSVVRRDTQAPQIEIATPKPDELVTGTIYVSGRIADDGAINVFEALVGNEKIPLEKSGTFAFPVNLTTLNGKPIKVHAIDYAGNETIQNVEYQVGTPVPEKGQTNPQVQVLFPSADTKGLSGRVVVVGRVRNFTEAPSFLLKKGSQPAVTTDLTDSGWFTTEVDVSKDKETSFTLTAQNTVKEKAETNFRVPYDEAADVPLAQFLTGKEKTIIQGYATAIGYIKDDQGWIGWEWSLDAGEKRVVTPDLDKPPLGAFLLDLGTLSPGNHKILMTPIDRNGKRGKSIESEFVQSAPPGLPEVTNFEIGAPLEVTSKSTLKGRVFSPNTWKKLEIQWVDLLAKTEAAPIVQSLNPQKGSDGYWTFETPIPQNLPYSRIGITLSGEDSLGQKTEGHSFFHRIWPKAADDVHDGEGVYFDDTKIKANNTIELLPKQSLVGLFRGNAITKVALQPDVPTVKIEFNSDQLILTPAEQGSYGPFTVKVTTVDNETFTSPSYKLVSDLIGPDLVWDSPKTGDWVRDSLKVSGTLGDPSGLGVAEYSLDGGSLWQSLPLKKNAFDFTIPLAKIDDGPLSLTIRASDTNGYKTIETRTFSKDTVAPAVTIVTPPEGEVIKGLTTISGTVQEAGKTALVEYSDDGKNFKPADGTDVFQFNLDFASYKDKIPEKYIVRATDTAGNQSTMTYKFNINEELDKPVVQIQTPAKDEVVKTDFIISGMVFDDKGVKKILWRLDGGEWKTLEGANSFRIPIPLSSMKDNEHTIEMQAENISGTKGNIYTSTFRISLAEPSAVLFKPELDKTTQGIVSLEGASFDRNGIKAVYVSLDYGLTWNKSEFKKKEDLIAQFKDALPEQFDPKERQEWVWRFDTRSLKDGTYVVMVKTVDNYDIEGLYTTLVNLDNTAPDLAVSTPSDGDQITDNLRLEGRISDNLNLVGLKFELRTIAGPKGEVPTGPAVLKQDLPLSRTFGQDVKLSNLQPGWYNLRVEAQDAAGNTTWIAKNVRLDSATAIDRTEMIYPESGESLNGSFVLEGRVTSRKPVQKALIQIDGKTAMVADVDSRGFFQAPLDGTLLSDGEHQLLVKAEISESQTIASEPRLVLFQSEGPWLKITSHRSGSFVTQRPFIEGTAGWKKVLLPEGADPKAKEDEKRFLENHRPTLVQVSLDNGRTFKDAQGNELWKYRLESLEIPDGPLPMIFRATFQDGSVAIRRLLVTVNQTPPEVTLLTPQENGHYSGILKVSGFASAKYGLQSVSATLRTGDKGSYEVPSFIQGSYFDQQFLGATWWSSAVGLTFFQDNVKLQAQIGQSPEGRFSGMVIGSKLIANVAQIPFSFFLGPDWNWYSMSFGLGANFSYFTNSDKPFDFSKTGVFLGSVLAQWELAKVTLRDLTFFKSYSWYGELTVWFISSDVQASAEPRFSTGIRIGLF